MINVYAAQQICTDATVSPWVEVIGDWTLIHTTDHNERPKLFNASIKQAKDSIWSLVFDVYPGHVYFGGFTIGRTLIKAYNGSEQLFFGRVCGIESRMDSDGSVYQHVTCEHCEAFMLDSSVEFDNDTLISYDCYSQSNTLLFNINELCEDRTYPVSALDLVRTALWWHNNTCSRTGQTFKQVKLTYAGDWMNQTIYVSDRNCTLCREFIRSITDDIAAEVSCSYDETNHCVVMNIDNRTSKNVIGTVELGRNMVSCHVSDITQELVTGFELFYGSYKTTATSSGGATVEEMHHVEDYWAIAYSSSCLSAMEAARQDVEDYYGIGRGHIGTEGLDLHRLVYLMHEERLKYGSIIAKMTVEDVVPLGDYPDDLEAAMQSVSYDTWYRIYYKLFMWLREKCKLRHSVNAEVLDLSLIDNSYRPLSIFTWWNLKNELIDLDESAEIVERTIDLSALEKSTVTFGTPEPKAVDTSMHYRMKADETIVTASTETLSTSRGTTSSGTYQRSSVKLSGGDGWTHQVNGVAQKTGTINFVTGS